MTSITTIAAVGTVLGAISLAAFLLLSSGDIAVEVAPDGSIKIEIIWSR